MNNAIKGLAKSVGQLAGITSLVILGKQAIQTASDLQEVQNVVDVSFGKAAAEINAFAADAMKAFGLTELQAKRTASTLMAMSNGMNINADAGKVMSINLTKLSGDMASFYNVTQDVAETALKSVFTGETESLKKFGVVMTEANLQAFALSQGIETLYSEMSQAQRVALRYNYVMQATANAQGDFARTSNNWANQVRILQGQWGQLLATIGTGLTAVLAPLLGVLNKILAAAIGIVNTFARIFGGTGIAKVSTTLSDASVGADGLSEGLDKSADSAKKLKRWLAGFDELNVVDVGDDSGSGSSASAGAGANIAVPDYYGDITETAGIEKGFNEVLELFNSKIKEYYDAVSAFGTTLGEKFNGAFQSVDWVLLGETIGNGISLVYETANNFLETVSWYKLGESLASGINSAFDTIKWEEIGENIANRINAIGLTFAGFVDTIDFEKIGKSLQTRFNSAINNIEWQKIGGALGTGLTGAFKILETFLQGGTIENLGFKISDAINSAMMSFDATLAGEGINNLCTQLIKAFENIDWTLVAAKIREFLDALDIVGIIKAWISAYTDTLGSIIAGVFNIPEGVADNIADFIFLLQGLSTILGALVPIGMNFISVMADLTILNTLRNPIAGITNEMGLMTVAFKKGEGIKEYVYGIAEAINDKWSNSKLGKVFKNVINYVDDIGVTFKTAVGTVVSQSGIVLTNGTKLEKFVTLLSAGFKGLWAVIKAHPIAAVITAIVAITTSVMKLWNTSAEFRQFVHDLYNNTIKPVIEQVQQTLKNLWNNHLKPLWESIKELFGLFKDALGGVWTTIQQIIGWIVGLLGGTFLSTWVNVFGSILTTVTNIIGGVMDILRGIIDFLIGVFTGDWQKAWGGIQTIIQGIFTAISSFINGKINIIIGFINGMIGGIVSGINVAIRALNRLQVKVPDWVPSIGGKYFGFSIKELSAPKIPLLANGGVINQPTMAMVGEAGKEVVLPLEKNTAWMDTLADKIAARNTSPTKIVLKVGERELGWATINGINQITKQTGELQLVL